ncbi:hypothetical protein SASPL_143037 [Salvia splendens]|uniref:Uncharacterized protein n=1 Tax=Salvia splendens TaxID=180675 RepID=A0A8X8WMV1_SALSN|nr:hypothetical protein SASPL_143037 [Salvia splendens]
MPMDLSFHFLRDRPLPANGAAAGGRCPRLQPARSTAGVTRCAPSGEFSPTTNIRPCHSALPHTALLRCSQHRCWSPAEAVAASRGSRCCCCSGETQGPPPLFVLLFKRLRRLLVIKERDFKQELPRKLLMGMSCLFSGIAAMLLSFCAGHTFIPRKKLRIAAVPIYAAVMLPVVLFAIGKLPLYFDILWLPIFES